MDETALRVTIAASPGADARHIHSPQTVGEVVARLLAVHPWASRATTGEIEALVEATAELDGRSQVAYALGGRKAGMLGGPGTWIGIEPTRSNLDLSHYVPDLYPAGDPPVDPTIMARLAGELAPRVAALGGDPDAVELLEPTRGAFSGEDVVRIATANGPMPAFAGHLAHIRPPYSPSTCRSLDAAAQSVVTHQRHGAAIARRVADVAARIAKRFGPLARHIGETEVIGVEQEGDDAAIETATLIDVPDDRLMPSRVLLRMRDPYVRDAQSFDGFRRHSREAKRRLATLGGRAPIDAWTVCGVVARHYASLPQAEARAKAAAIREIESGARDNDDGRSGPDFKDGRLEDTVPLGGETTYRGISLMTRHALPDAVMLALAGRPLTDLVDDPHLAGIAVEQARRDSKGRLIVRTTRLDPVPLRPILEAMEAR